MKKVLSVFLISVLVLCMFTSCSDSSSGKVIAENEKNNKEYLDTAVSAMNHQTLALQDAVDWGFTFEQITEVVEEPYISAYPQYLTRAFYAALPSGSGWLDAEKNLNTEDFVPIDILSYYAIDAGMGLYEYGYLAPDVNLHQYDFLKDYYTKKYGEPAEENWEWKNPSYQPDGEEDYYQMFAEGLVKVVTVWDIKELNSVLIIDWLNDPKNYNNNFGQISFYERSDDFSVEEAE